MKRFAAIMLFISFALFLLGCQNGDITDTDRDSDMFYTETAIDPDTETAADTSFDTEAPDTEALTADESKDTDTSPEPTETEEIPTETAPPEPEIFEAVYPLSEDFVYPNTDGSTSTVNLNRAVRSYLVGTDAVVLHSTTYNSFYNLLDGKCELIFTTPLSDEQYNDIDLRQDKLFR